eukprot:TRINITY_DN7116_c0_g1_i1.p1 TRINITY_DN7116_c0_g1~~TRINITY_DN7116_c0_g1_i1.p1  ORF type:complete len:602 (+),score=105.47 TRINITY_DN7116_c0_g1_i1:39-1808(+)
MSCCKRCFKPIHMSDKDRMLLSPLEKWKKYRRFPFKIFIQLIVLFVISMQIYVLVNDFTLFTRANREGFRNFLVLEELQAGGMRLYDIDLCLKQIQYFVEQYFMLDSLTIAKYTYFNEGGDVAPVYLTMHKYHDNNGTVVVSEIDTEYYKLTSEDPLGPFTGLDRISTKELLYTVDDMTLDVAVVNEGGTTFGGLIPFQWNITLEFNHIGGEIVLTLRTEREIIADDDFSRSGWLSLISLVVCSISFSLSSKAVWSSYEVYKRTKIRFKSIPNHRLELRFRELGIKPVTSWGDVPFDVKVSFFSSWHLFSVIGDLCIIGSCASGIYTAVGLPTSDFGRFLLGMGSFVLFSNMTKYLEYNRKFYILIMSLKLAFKRIVRFIFSSAPIFLGYLCCGVVAFSPYSDSFVDMENTGITLFALLNGDDIHATFDALIAEYPYPTLAEIYLYSFIMLFITAVLNIFIFIIEDAYHLSKALAMKSKKGNALESLGPNFELDWDQLEKLQSTLNMEKLFTVIELEDPDVVFDSLVEASSLRHYRAVPEETPKNIVKQFLDSHRRETLSEIERLIKQKEARLLNDLEDYIGTLTDDEE